MTIHTSIRENGTDHEQEAIMGSSLNHPRTARVAVMLMTAVVGAACGGGGAKQVSEPAAAPPLPVSSSAAAKAAGGSGDFCEAAKAQFAHAATADASSFDPAERRQVWVTSKELTAKVVKTAPGEIRSDVEKYARVTDAAADAWISEDPQAVKRSTALLTAPDVQVTAKRVSVYVQSHCGFEVTTSGG